MMFNIKTMTIFMASTVLLTKAASDAFGSEDAKPMGILVLGGNLTNLSNSCDDRLVTAQQLHLKDTTRGAHYFFSGHKGEAVYMKMSLDILYAEQFLKDKDLTELTDFRKHNKGKEVIKSNKSIKVKAASGEGSRELVESVVVVESDVVEEWDRKFESYRNELEELDIHYEVTLDRKAMFTVMNFLKAIPQINEAHAENEFDSVYLVTSDYHMVRSMAIANSFQEAGLLIFDKMVPCKATEGCAGKGKDAWLDIRNKNGDIPRKGILDPTRDAKNSKLFATAISNKMRSVEVGEMENLAGAYAELNNAETKREIAAKHKQFREYVDDFIENSPSLVSYIREKCESRRLRRRLNRLMAA